MGQWGYLWVRGVTYGAVGALKGSLMGQRGRADGAILRHVTVGRCLGAWPKCGGRGQNGVEAEPWAEVGGASRDVS